MTTQDRVAVGAVLAGRYRIERVLGRGGMGIVVQAMHLQLQQPVAMKFLLPEMLGNPQVVQRFLREAQAAVRLKSEHVARVLDVGSLETGEPYMVLEYLEGTDLASFPRSQLGVGGIIDLMLQACESLAEAHTLGIVHRDIKPANFFLTRGADGTPLLKVLDFGISKAPTTGGQLTATQAVMGTPAYMSPEQMRSSRDVDHRSDIWSLGVVLYELLQGAPPFGGDTFSSMVLKVVNDPLPRLTVRLPDELDSVVYCCLEKDPARRFQDVAALALALARYAQSETQAAISVRRTRSIVGAEPPGPAFTPGMAVHAVLSTLSGAAGARTEPRRGGRRWPIAAAMAGLIGGLVVVVVASRGGGPGATSPVSPASPAASSQPSDASAVAEQLFKQARELAKANRWAEACPKFEASLRADPVLGTRLNLADCYEHLGKLASAWGMFREAVELATKAGDKRRAYAQKQADALEPRLPKLTISVPDNPPAGLVVARDGAPIDAGALGVALYVDPGAHAITASAPGFEVFTRTVTLAEGKAETLALPALTAVPVSATAPTQAPPQALNARLATTAQPELVISPTRKYVAVATGVAGVASIGVGLLFGGKANSAYHDAKALCGSNLVCRTDNYARGQQLIRDTRLDATISTVLVAAGGAAIVTGAVVWLTGRRPRERGIAQVVPVTYDRGSGLAVMGRF